MRKKSVILLTSLLLIANTVNTYAYQPKMIGDVLSSDVIAYIDKMPIRCYNYANSIYVLARDLRNYGFEVTWNSDARTVNITLPEKRTVKKFSADEKQALEKREPTGIKKYDFYQTDIQTLFDGKPVTSTNAPAAINADGKTLILFQSLGNHFGRTEWSDPYRIANIYTNDGQLPIETFTTDFGLQYQEMNPIPLNTMNLYRCQTSPAGTQQMIGIVTIWLYDVHQNPRKNSDGTYMEDTYIHMNQNLIDAFDLKIIANDTNTLSLETPHASVIFENLTANELSYMPSSVYRTNITLSHASSDNQDLPDFLSIEHELYVNSQALAKSLDMETDFNDFGIGVFEKTTDHESPKK